MDRASLRDVIRRKLDDGTLPTKAPNKIYTGYGSGATCGACGGTIYRTQAEYELTYTDLRRVFRLHSVCWDLGGAAPAPRPGSGILASCSSPRCSFVRRSRRSPNALRAQRFSIHRDARDVPLGEGHREYMTPHRIKVLWQGRRKAGDWLRARQSA